jgi:K+-transporting ATPase KdpF subunit
LDRRHDRIFCCVDRLRALLRSCEIERGDEEENDMSWESIIMLIISAATMVYLIYALLRPEKF